MQNLCELQGFGSEIELNCWQKTACRLEIVCYWRLMVKTVWYCYLVRGERLFRSPYDNACWKNEVSKEWNRQQRMKGWHAVWKRSPKTLFDVDIYNIISTKTIEWSLFKTLNFPAHVRGTVFQIYFENRKRWHKRSSGQPSSTKLSNAKLGGEIR